MNCRFMEMLKKYCKRYRREAAAAIDMGDQLSRR